LLRDDQTAPDEALPRTGISLEWERMLSAAFIHAPTYATRSSTALLVSRYGMARFTEGSFAPDGGEAGRIEYAFQLE